MDSRRFRTAYVGPHGRRCLQEWIQPRRGRAYWRIVNDRHWRSRSIADWVFAAFPTKASVLAASLSENSPACLPDEGRPQSTMPAPTRFAAVGRLTTRRLSC